MAPHKTSQRRRRGLYFEALGLLHQTLETLEQLKLKMKISSGGNSVLRAKIGGQRPRFSGPAAEGGGHLQPWQAGLWTALAGASSTANIILDDAPDPKGLRPLPPAPLHLARCLAVPEIA